MYCSVRVNNLQGRRQERLLQAENKQYELDFQYLHCKEDESLVSFIVERQMKTLFMIV